MLMWKYVDKLFLKVLHVKEFKFKFIVELIDSWLVKRFKAEKGGCNPWSVREPA